MASETFIVVDIETTGPVIGTHSMLSLGAIAIDREGKELGTYSRNLRELPDATWDPKTKSEFWDENPLALSAATKDPIDPVEAMQLFSYWVKRLPGQPVPVAMPFGFDFPWIYYYLMRFTGESPFSFSGWDMKGLAASILNLPYRQAVKRNWPKHWFDKKLRHTHIALDDAREQAYSFVQMLKDLDKLHEKQ